MDYPALLFSPPKTIQQAAQINGKKSDSDR